MISRQIISPGDSMQILANDLRKQSLEERAAELKSASATEREPILPQIERHIEKEVQKRLRNSLPHGTVLYGI